MAVKIDPNPDPLTLPGIEVKTVRAGVRLSRVDRPVLTGHVYYRGGMHCGARHEGSGWNCTRPAGHPDHWKHVAASSGEIWAVWGGGDPPEGQWYDEPDGTPDDPADLVVEAPEVGGVYRLRDRENKLQVIGGLDDSKRPDGLIEVLDLKRREFRALPKSELVPTDYVLSVDDVLFVVEYTQSVRDRVREEGIANYHKGKWCFGGLQDSLKDLGLPEYVPEQRGYVVVRVPYSAPTDTATEAAKDALLNLFPMETLKALSDDNNPNDVRLRASALEVRVEGVERR